ncbi:unnamed protein product [Parnassius mnemosyne]|uniref:Uncharacterized protein n=1 Tax=Parnassius mnemosyne TaxID=213953 RepID=A0AAV1KCM6_9NEOP
MEKFEFSSTSSGPRIPKDPFSGHIFYNVYKEAEFLRHSDNIETILAKGYELRQKLKNVLPGQQVMIDGIWLEKNTPLLVKKTGPNVEVENFEFTANRLSGLVAAYAFENRKRFPIVTSSEALALGLKWDNTNTEKCKLYLSAVSGTEHFYDQFTYWPLICALRKLQMKKITLEPVIKIAKIKNKDGVRMAKDLMNNRAMVYRLWLHFPGASNVDLKCLLQTAPVQLKNVLTSND